MLNVFEIAQAASIVGGIAGIAITILGAVKPAPKARRETPLCLCNDRPETQGSNPRCPLHGVVWSEESELEDARR